ncbi:MFS transporter [Agromyces binzhouensis]|uniref:MFS transporter n=1 Tax=Agromyces binzhouensis TaxID=1817495 RepID=UPI003638478F
MKKQGAPPARGLEIRRHSGFGIAIAGMVAMMVGASAPSPFYPSLQAALGLTPVAITAVFAIYALVLLAALLTVGSLSDHFGRRPIVSAGFVLLAISVLVFWNAESAGTLLLARALQGMASGLLLSSLSAAVAELGPQERPGVGATWIAVSPLVGLALGAFVGGAALDITPDALAVVFGALGIGYVALAGLAWVAPETSPRAIGWTRSLRPRLSVPPPIRTLLLAGVPALVAGWANGGLILSLGASIVQGHFGVTGHVGQGLVVGLLAAAAAVSALLTRRSAPRTATILGTSLLAAGTAVTLAALVIQSLPIYLSAIFVAGAGFGASFTGVLRSIAAVVDARDRAGTFASLYVVSYLSFGLPAVIAGLLVPILTLDTTTLLYGGTVVLIAALASALRARTSA